MINVPSYCDTAVFVIKNGDYSVFVNGTEMSTISHGTVDGIIVDANYGYLTVSNLDFSNPGLELSFSGNVEIAHIDMKKSGRPVRLLDSVAGGNAAKISFGVNSIRLSDSFGNEAVPADRPDTALQREELNQKDAQIEFLNRQIHDLNERLQSEELARETNNMSSDELNSEFNGLKVRLNSLEDDTAVENRISDNQLEKYKTFIKIRKNANSAVEKYEAALAAYVEFKERFDKKIAKAQKQNGILPKSDLSEDSIEQTFREISGDNDENSDDE